MNDSSKTNFTSSENVCLVSADFSLNHLDHLAVIGYIMDAPMVCDTELLYETTKKYYPQVKPIHIHFHQQILEYLALHHNRLFFSVAPYRKDLSPLLEAFYGKKMEFWYCPHGNSDKRLKHFELQEYALIYSDQMEERLINEGYMPFLKSYIRTGNVRFSFYHKYKSFYDDLVEKEVFAKFVKPQTTYLYAPTWQDLDHSSSFFDASIPLLDELPDSINLIVKMHPWLEHHQPGHVKLIQEKYKDRPNMVILCQYPLVLPILERTDLYIGDFSSIGYDFLRYDRPMFFFDSEKRKRSHENDTQLHSCGTVIPTDQYMQAFQFIDKHLKQQETLSEKRKKLYHYAFGEELSFESIKCALQDSAPASVTPGYS
ncbi:CDP-glycerol glycerophosphotransferase family protein [Simkania sp.]|uniref:CDP-glycerol glycerophosphotransferase family protein n=1 Tax=Simkania sp. TaxID=34094 RepID=UPI003B52EA5D